jgi:hypothetical protein
MTDNVSVYYTLALNALATGNGDEGQTEGFPREENLFDLQFRLTKVNHSATMSRV